MRTKNLVCVCVCVCVCVSVCLCNALKLKFEVLVQFISDLHRQSDASPKLSVVQKVGIVAFCNFVELG